MIPINIFFSSNRVFYQHQGGLMLCSFLILLIGLYSWYPWIAASHVFCSDNHIHFCNTVLCSEINAPAGSFERCKHSDSWTDYISNGTVCWWWAYIWFSVLVEQTISLQNIFFIHGTTECTLLNGCFEDLCHTYQNIIFIHILNLAVVHNVL